MVRQSYHLRVAGYAGEGRCLAQFYQLPDQKEAFAHERTAALVGKGLIEKLGWRLGQDVTIRGGRDGIDVRDAFTGIERGDCQRLAGGPRLEWRAREFFPNQVVEAIGVARTGRKRIDDE